MTENSEEPKKQSPLSLGKELIKALEKFPQKPGECVKLIEAEADVGLIRLSDRYNALMLASGIGFSGVVSAALRRGSPVNQKNDIGNTALLEAMDAFSLALKGQERMPFVDNHGRARDYIKTIRLLLEWNADTRIKNSSGQDTLDIIRDLHDKYGREDTKILLDEVFMAHKRQESMLMLTQGTAPKPTPRNS